MSGPIPGHAPGFDEAPEPRDGLARIREDVHVHAGAPDVRALLADSTAYRDWLPPAIQQFQADSEGMRFVISLPGRTEEYSLRRDASADPREVVYRIDAGGVAETLSWGLYPEGPHECHVTLEVAYRPARGLFGGSMETMVHRPQRTQVLRDFLWNLKRAAEGHAPDPTASA